MEQKRKIKIAEETGITLIAMIITIIVMLILAGVSLNAVIGENGILTQATKASIVTTFSKYAEEFETNITSKISADDISGREKVTLLNEYVKEYIPSLADNDVGNFAIVNGVLYYVGDSETDIEACETVGIAAGKTLEDIENEAIIQIVESLAGTAFMETDEEGNETEVGVKLYDKNLTNGDKWKIITEINNNETVATYGTGWYYVAAGTTIDSIGTLKYSYIINYETSKAVKFDGSIHTMLAYGSNIAVTDNLVFNIDPINMSDNSGDSWGDVTLVGFSNEGDFDNEGNQVSGYYGTGILLDGVDDEIDFYAGDDFEEGFTLTYYGKFLNDEAPIFSKQNGEDIPTSVRTSVTKEYFSLCLTKNRADSSWSFSEGNDNNGWLYYYWDEELSSGTDYYIDITFSSENYECKIYLNGICLGSTVVNESYWDGGNLFSVGGKQVLEDLDTICRIGCFYGGNPAMWHFGALDFYCIRLYNSCLSNEELVANYNATVSYHNILVNGGTAESGGETGGEDIGTVE